MATNKLHAPIKITITERGRAIQKELMKELRFDDSFRISPSGGRHKSGSPSHIGPAGTNSNRESNYDISRREITRRSVPLDQNTSRIYNNKSFRSHSRESEIIKLPKIHFRPNLEQNPFIRSKVTKLNREIERLELQTEKSFKEHTETVSHLLPSDSRNILPSMHDQSLVIQMPDRPSLQDKFMVRHYVKMLHAESEVEKIVKRHEKNMLMMKRIEEEVQKRYRKMKAFQDEEDHKKPELLDDIREEHADAIAALQKQTFYGQRKQERIKLKTVAKYRDVWNKFQDLGKKK